MTDQLFKDLQDEPRRSGVALYIVLSLVLHGTFVILWLISRPVEPVVAKPPVRFVEFVRPPNREFVEAPGPKLKAPPRPDAPFSNANRRASTPNPTGTQRTTRPGDGTFYNPEAASARPAQPQPRPQRPMQPSQQQPVDAQRVNEAKVSRTNMPPLRASAAAVDWSNAIREVSRQTVADGGSGSGSPSLGGDQGFAESGPVSFETQWYDWGDYADAMVRKIRRNWYDNMPELIKMGMKGVVTIQFTIERSGTISQVTILSSSQIPPFDFAAKKAIEISSPLAPLPADFPNPRERVTCQFYYNMKVPRRDPSAR